ncbi:hypothetical protein HA48_15600 [Pantoea wallisii]|uniref:MafI family immunity protein n=1 Tax=Pantoea wallisii TaxID=1076551 RepID=A0A1X1D4B2_9GAMM|nr:MafI family immunity protein [Pantoea wallisii]ORM71486.1 hypothetical protein HA48_15600 [Pantoea wallisii]
MDVNDEIIQLGEGLKGRLEPSLIDFALGYITHVEAILAFETLCDYIADYNVKLRKDEYEKIINTATKFGLSIDIRYTYINPERHQN